MKLNGTTRGLTLALTTTLAVSAVPFLTSSASAAPGTLSLVATSADGAAFDLDEHAAGDLTVQVTDSIAGGVDVDDAQDLQYHWTITPFDATAPAVRVPATGEDVEAVDVAGAFVVPLPAAQAPGTYALVAGLGPDASSANAIPGAAVLTVKAGNAELAFDDETPCAPRPAPMPPSPAGCSSRTARVCRAVWSTSTSCAGQRAPTRRRTPSSPPRRRPQAPTAPSRPC